jgi:protein-S-isoprenylcysteine O-methyltransferase Ste14
MDLDQTFRIILIVGSLLLFPVAMYYRLRSQATRERLDRWQEGPVILFTLRPVGIASVLGLIAYMINPSRMAWSSVPLPEWLRWAGVGVGVIAGGLLVWTFRSLGKNLTDTVVTRREHTLVTTGPYRWVRHPFYDSVALCVLANSLAAANWFLLLTGGLAFVLMMVRTRTEEEKLLARFGDSYRAYMERTGRFLPKI